MLGRESPFPANGVMILGRRGTPVGRPGASRTALPGWARLHHRSSTDGESLHYSIVQTTDLKGGRAVRQVSTLEDPTAREV